MIETNANTDAVFGPASGQEPQAFQTPTMDMSTLRVSEAIEPFLLYCRVEKQYAAESQVKMKEAFDSWLLRHIGGLELTAIRHDACSGISTSDGDKEN